MAGKTPTDTTASPGRHTPESEKQQGAAAQMAVLWKTLATISTLRFSVHGSATRGAMDYEGSGRVRITWLDTTAMEYDEEGSWHHPSGKIIHFRNIYRWIKDDIAGCIKLYHRRNDAVEPVFLCEFVPSGAGRIVHATPHVCGHDTYLGELQLTADGMDLCWRIRGPAKNDLLSIIYRFGSSDGDPRSDAAHTDVKTR